MNDRTRSVGEELREAVGALLDALVTTARGLIVTGRYALRPSEIVTVRYPRERLEVPANYRGLLVNDVARCISCELCARACPAGCITVRHETGADRKRILAGYRIDMQTCLFCGLCTEACPDSTRDAGGAKCLTMTGGYESSTDRKESIEFAWTADEPHLRAARAAAEARAAAAKTAAAAKRTAEAKG